MRAIQLSSFGGPEVMEYKEIPTPEPEAGEVRVRLYAAGVNPAETYMRTGSYAFYKPALPAGIGFDGAGVIDAVGAGVTRLKKGERVFVSSLLAKKKTGTYAEFVVTDEDAVHPLPEFVSFEQGAAMGVPGLAAYCGMFQRARLMPGETIFIHGASGGVGTLGVQMATARGARVLASAGSPKAMQMVRDLGADEVFNHNEEGYMDKMVKATGGKGPDVIIEMLADANLEEDMKRIAMYGRVVINGSRGSLTFTPRLMMIKESALYGMAIWNFRPEEFREANYFLAAGLRTGVLKPVIGQSYPLAEAKQAHIDIIEKGGKLGKVVLTIE